MARPLEGPLREQLERWLDDGGYNQLLALAKRVAKVDPENLVQDTLLHASIASSWRRYDPAVGSIFEHLKMIMYTRQLDTLTRVKIVDQGSVALPEDDVFGTDETVDFQTRMDLEAAIGSIKEPYRTAFHLVEVEGMSYEEAALKMGKSRPWLWKQLIEAKRQLREKLVAYESTYVPRESDSSLHEKSQQRAA